ncbi:MAG: sensor histidine kinase [Bacteroidetes bacterium]|nr:sensor histidine kinase [Bacteroidota bacterium]
MLNFKWQHKLFLLTLAVAIIPAMLISYNMINIAGEKFTDSVNFELLTTANNLAKDVNQFMVSTLQKTALLKKGLENPDLNVDSKVSLMVSNVETNNEFLAIDLVFDAGNKTFSDAVGVKQESFDSLLTSSGVSYNNFIRKRYDEIIEHLGNNKYLGDVEYLTEIQKWVVLSFYEVKITNAPKAYLISLIDLSGLGERLFDDKFNQSGTLYIIDKNKNYVFSKPSFGTGENTVVNDAAEMLSKTARASGVTNFKRNGSTVVACFSFPQNIDWAVIAEMDKDKAYTAVSKMNNVFILWILIGLFLAAIGVMVFTKILGKPIHYLSQKANDISNGNFDISISYNKNDSLGVLSNSLLNMSKSLKQSFSKIEQQNIELAEYNLTLEDKVKERTIELKKVNENLQDAYLKVLELNKEKNEFLGIAAHDLKNPLAAIKGFGNILMEEPEISRDEIEQFAQIIVSSSDRMFSIVSSLLDINKIEEGKIIVKYNEFEVHKSLLEIIESNKNSAKNKDIEIITDLENITSVNDKEIFAQIIDNILSNAIKFSPVEKRIFVKLNRLDNNFIISVKDEGPGFTEEDKVKLFAKFVKLSARPTGGENSTGLGLSIVKKLTELIGADIRVDSIYGQGAEFIITFPIS